MRIFNVDLTLTNACNFKCSYCFEEGQMRNDYFHNTYIFIEAMEDLLCSEFFENNYDLLNIGFWGGEPSLNSPVIREIVEAFGDTDLVKFFIFTNGYDISPLWNTLQQYNGSYIGEHPKFCVQVSYDGKPIQSLCRRTITNHDSTDKVRETIQALDFTGIPYVIKSTVTPENFKFLFSAYKDIRSIWERNQNSTSFRNTRFFPTIDYYNLNRYSDDIIKYFCKDLETVLVEIAKEELEFYKKYGRFFFAWFNRSKSLCSAGRDMICVDWNGLVYKCHGANYASYDDKVSHMICNIESEDFLNKIVESYHFHNVDFGYQPEECKSCIASFCLRCNIVKFSNSKKFNYVDKWRDYTNQPKLCEFYRTNGKVVLALEQIIK